MLSWSDRSELATKMKLLGVDWVNIILTGDFSAPTGPLDAVCLPSPVESHDRPLARY